MGNNIMKTKLGNTVKDTIWYSVGETLFGSVYSLKCGLINDSIWTIVVDSVHKPILQSTDSLVYEPLWGSILNSTNRQINNFITQP